MVDAATAIQEETLRCPFLLRISEGESDSRAFFNFCGAAMKYDSGWIEQVILIGWKFSSTLMVKLNYAPKKKKIQVSFCYKLQYYVQVRLHLSYYKYELVKQKFSN